MVRGQVCEEPLDGAGLVAPVRRMGQIVSLESPFAWEAGVEALERGRCT